MSAQICQDTKVCTQSSHPNISHQILPRLNDLSSLLLVSTFVTKLILRVPLWWKSSFWCCLYVCL